MKNLYHSTVHEILRHLRPEETVLDLGCGAGSFAACAGTILRIDRETPKRKVDHLILADATALPLANRSLDAIVSNHSLEHFAGLDSALDEIGRTLKPSGTLFVSVPDASTFTDRLYRWLARGGGHVNPFTDVCCLASRIQSRTGLQHRATRPLFSSLSFLHRANRPGPAPRRLLLLGGGAEWTLRAYTLVSRWADRVLGTRIGLYGWALYFGQLREEIDTTAWPSVCIRCGSGTSSERLQTSNKTRKHLGVLQTYDCPVCSTWNFAFEDRRFRHIR